MNRETKRLLHKIVLGLLIFCGNAELFAQIACSTGGSNTRTAYYTYSNPVSAPAAVKNMSCTYLGFSATVGTSKRIYLNASQDLRLISYNVPFTTTSQVSNGTVAIDLNLTT